MAIDLGTSLSPYEYQNMLPLDVLAAVASETLKNEINSSDNSEVKTLNNFKKQIKKSTASVLTLNDIKSLPLKSLVDKFSEMTSDELTKKYFYKCLLLPDKCAMTFKSFGNEKQACDKIKSHLLSHVQQLLLELESNNEISKMVFVPRSPNSTSKHTEKLSKKSLKKQQISMSHVLPRTSSFKVSKKEKNSQLLVKKAKKKLNATKKRMSELKKCFGKNKAKVFHSVYLKKTPCAEKIKDESYLSDKELLMKRCKEEIIDEEDIGWESEFYSNYSKHLKYIFFSNVAAKEQLSDSDYEHVSHSNDQDNFLDEINQSSVPTFVANLDKPFTFLHDHNYASSGEIKHDKIFTSEFKSMPHKYEDPFLQKPTVQTQLIIRTPPFPFVHTPLLPEVAEIKEIDDVECLCGSDECSNYGYGNYLSDTSKVQSDTEEIQTDEQFSDIEEKYSSSIFFKMNGASSSVLECVENIVNQKYSSSCVPKSEISANENDENLENMQKFEKELALKYIAKLHSKGKKKIPDSLICQICPDKHFTAQATLIHHYRSHAGIKPYICEICSAKFTRQHSLNYHMLIHENRSRFTCEFCGRTFRHPSHYKEHLRRHTGETPYHCTDCNLHFKTRNTFKRHLKTRHGKLLTAGGIEDLNVE